MDRERVKRDIALIIVDDRGTMQLFLDGEGVDVPSCNDRADKILSIKGLAVLAEDQSLPRNPHGAKAGEEHPAIENCTYGQAQKDMWDDSFRRVENYNG